MLVIWIISPLIFFLSQLRVVQVLSFPLSFQKISVSHINTYAIELFLPKLSFLVQSITLFKSVYVTKEINKNHNSAITHKHLTKNITFSYAFWHENFGVKNVIGLLIFPTKTWPTTFPFRFAI